MRYKLDASGYIRAVSFGCDIDGGTEYIGAIPSGYKTLDDWATDSCIQAYYIDVNGNLVLDFERKIELENRQEQETIDNSCVLRKDIFDTEEALEGQYIREIATGKVVILKDIKTIAPKVKITGIQNTYKKLSLYAHGKNMMPCHAESCVISGVTFTKNASGSLTILGTSTEPIEYVIADGKDTTLFALKPNLDYYLNLGGLQCELSYFDGETTAQQYIGASGLLNLPEHIEVTKVVIKIASGDSLNTTFYPQLEYGNAFTEYDSHKLKALEINIGELESEFVYPSDELFASDTLYPGISPKTVNYILVENGKVSISVDNKVKISQNGSMGLFSKYNTIYATKDVDLEIEYSANFLLVDSLAFLQGKATTTKRFKILEDGSIEANNGYFSGKIEADSGYFKGAVEWEQIKDKDGNPVDNIVTKITRDTVTTEYVNALNVKAGSVNAENITGTTIHGKTLSGGSISIGGRFSVDDTGTVVANSLKSNNAEITGGSINISSSIYDYSVIQLNSGFYSNKFSPVNVRLDSSMNYAILNSTGLTFSEGIVTTKVLTTDTISAKGYKISINDPIEILDNTTFGAGYTHTFNGTVTMSGNVNLTGLSATLDCEGNAIISGAGKLLGFFGNSGATRRSVAQITAYNPDVSTVVSKLNALIKALQDYGLISNY